MSSGACPAPSGSARRATPTKNESASARRIRAMGLGGGGYDPKIHRNRILGRKVENRAYLARQGFRREGFLEIGDALLQNPVAHDRIIRIAGHEKNLRAWKEIGRAHV